MMLSHRQDGVLENASTLTGVSSTSQQPPAFGGDSHERGKHGTSTSEGKGV